MDLHVHIISRDKAKELGMKRYFTGKPCKRGGIGERHVSVKRCQCDLCREHGKESMKKYNQENRESLREYSRKYRKENRDSILEARRKYYREHWEATRDAARAPGRKYYRKNKHIFAANLARRRAAKIQRTLMDDCELTHLVESEAYSLASERKEQTGFDWHVDHLIPLRGDYVSGLHHWSNLQVIPASLNLSKGNRMIYTEPFEWLKDA